MSAPVSTIRNLGPAADSGYGRAGINTAAELRVLGADTAYARYLAAGGQAHFIGYYALVMGLQGRPWNDCRGAEKSGLRIRFDAIKASVKDKGTSQSKLDRELARIGVIKR
jgi:TfoX-like protein